MRRNYLLLGYYEAGFRVFDISNPVNPVEVGKYETWRDPDGDGTFNQSITGNYNGVWDVYVFLPSGNVLVSDMKSGTFIFRVDPIAPPAAPGGISAAPGSGQVGLTWTAASGATGYQVQRGTTSGGPYTPVRSNIVGTTFTDTGLTLPVEVRPTPALQSFWIGGRAGSERSPKTSRSLSNNRPPPRTALNRHRPLR